MSIANVDDSELEAIATELADTMPAEQWATGLVFAVLREAGYEPHVVPPSVIAALAGAFVSSARDATSAAGPPPTLPVQ